MNFLRIGYLWMLFLVMDMKESTIFRISIFISSVWTSPRGGWCHYGGFLGGQFHFIIPFSFLCSKYHGLVANTLYLNTFPLIMLIMKWSILEDAYMPYVTFIHMDEC
ncbi:hypothetical protein P9112_007819 [Eukaryota sp. TZLM1-RC]